MRLKDVSHWTLLSVNDGGNREKTFFFSFVFLYRLQTAASNRANDLDSDSWQSAAVVQQEVNKHGTKGFLCVGWRPDRFILLSNKLCAKLQAVEPTESECGYVSVCMWVCIWLCVFIVLHHKQRKCVRNILFSSVIIMDIICFRAQIKSFLYAEKL